MIMVLMRLKGLVRWLIRVKRRRRRGYSDLVNLFLPVFLMFQSYIKRVVPKLTVLLPFMILKILKLLAVRLVRRLSSLIRLFIQWRRKTRFQFLPGRAVGLRLKFKKQLRSPQNGRVPLNRFISPWGSPSVASSSGQ